MSNSDSANLVFTMGACVLAIPIMGWLPLVAVAGTAALVACGSKACKGRTGDDRRTRHRC
jgi:hypothetical protein